MSNSKGQRVETTDILLSGRERPIDRLRLTAGLHFHTFRVWST